MLSEEIHRAALQDAGYADPYEVQRKRPLVVHMIPMARCSRTLTATDTATGGTPLMGRESPGQAVLLAGGQRAAHVGPRRDVGGGLDQHAPPWNETPLGGLVGERSRGRATRRRTWRARSS